MRWTCRVHTDRPVPVSIRVKESAVGPIGRKTPILLISCRNIQHKQTRENACAINQYFLSSDTQTTCKKVKEGFDVNVNALHIQCSV